MSKYKNAILILISIVLFSYAAFISIIPSLIASTVNKNKLLANYSAATGLNVSYQKALLKISPTFDTTITVFDLNVEFPDEQPVLSADIVELNTTPAAVFGKTIKIKNLYMKHVKYDDLVLPDGTNKLAYLPAVIDPKYIGKKGLTIIPGPTRIKNIDVSYTTTNPYSYKTQNINEINMTDTELKEFLQSLDLKHINIK